MSESAKTDTDRAGGDKHDLPAGIVQIRKHTAQTLDYTDVGLAVFVGNGGCSDLHDYAL